MKLRTLKSQNLIPSLFDCWNRENKTPAKLSTNKTLSERTLGRRCITRMCGYFVSRRNVVNCQGMVEVGENGDGEP